MSSLKVKVEESDAPVATVVAVEIPSDLSATRVARDSYILRTQFGLVNGLAKTVAESAKECPVRFWIVDNSGSMGIYDGHLNGRKSSRWDELCESLRWHGKVAAALGARTEFRLLNCPRGGAQQRVVIGGGEGGNDEGIEALNRVIESAPSGGTPLCAEVRKVVAKISALAPSLRASGQVASVIVASDGEASDGNVARALAPLADLPCSVVIRLCTDDSRVVSYWSDIDKDLELELDVLDNVVGESKEVKGHSPWLAYSKDLHRTREWGKAPKLLDVIDERSLTPIEARNLLEIILGGRDEDNEDASLPNPTSDSARFIDAVERRLCEVEPVFDASTGHFVPWVDTTILKRALASHRKNGGLLKPEADHRFTTVIVVVLLVCFGIFGLVGLIDDQSKSSLVAARSLRGKSMPGLSF